MEDRVRERREVTKKPVPAEGNFEEHPYFRVGDRNAGTGVLRYENELRTRDGNVLHQTWTVRGVHGRGLPGRFDQDVYVVLLQIIDRKGLPEDGWLSFSIYEIVELMGRSHSGRDYRQVRESLQRLASTSIESVNAFYHRGRKSYISDTFSLLSEVKLAEYESADGELTDRNRVHLSQYFVDSYKANYLKNLDARFYWSLTSPVAKRLYRLIDKKRGGRRVWGVDLFALKQKIPLSDYKYPSKIKEKLSPAHSELVAKGFLKKVAYSKSEDSESVIYEITESFQSRRKADSSLEVPTSEEYFCVQRLKAEGMSVPVAEELVASYGTGRAMQYVEALPYQKGVRNPAGWLRWAIQNAPDLDLPPVKSDSDDPSVGPGDETFDHTDVSAGPPDRVGREEKDEESGLSPAGKHVYENTAPDYHDDPAARHEWESLLEAAAVELEVPSLGIWFEECVPTSLEHDYLTVVAPNATAKDYIENRFKEVLERLLSQRLSRSTALRIKQRNGI